MTSVSGNNLLSMSTLFSSLNTTPSLSNNFGINLSDYGLIRSGAYTKMLKAYYSSDEAASSRASSVLGTTSTSKDTSQTLVQLKSASSDLVDSAKNLYTTGSKSLFNTETKTDSDGNKTEEYDKDKIYKAVDSFVSDYNSMIEAAGKSNTSSIARAGASLVNLTKANQNLLKDIGITIKSDYTLELDEETFKKADMNKVKSLFNGNGSYAYNVGVKASMMKSYAEIESSKANTYNGTGNFTYNYSTGTLYSDSF